MIYTDNKDFYPTPKSLFERLIGSDLRYLRGRILEPSAGKGDMVKHIVDSLGWSRKGSVQIDAIENDARLVNTLMGAGYNVVWDDFLTYDTFKQYDAIVMNPPFSNGVDHVLKALDLAESQLGACKIYAILNKQTLDNAYTDKRQALLRKLDEHGAEIGYVSEAFSQAERKTDVEVALIRANVMPTKDAGKSVYDRIPFQGSEARTDESLETALSTYVKSSEVADKLNDIERYILEYETACELAREAYAMAIEKQRFYDYLRRINQGASRLDDRLYLYTKNEATAEGLNEELDRLRRGYWQLILDTHEFRRNLTNEGIQQLNKRLDVANQMEINLTNIRMLLMAIGANKADMLIESIVAIFKRITRHHMNQYSSNIHYYDGWKTNNAYRINKKIIYPIQYGHFDSWDFGDEYADISRGVREFIDDIVKAFQLIDERFNNDFKALSRQEFENDLLRFKMFKNGNVHIWFNDLDALNKLNYICGSHFGWIPSEGEQKENPKAREWVAKEFGDMGEVKLLRT